MINMPIRITQTNISSLAVIEELIRKVLGAKNIRQNVEMVGTIINMPIFI